MVRVFVVYHGFTSLESHCLPADERFSYLIYSRLAKSRFVPHLLIAQRITTLAVLDAITRPRLRDTSLSPLLFFFARARLQLLPLLSVAAQDLAVALVLLGELLVVAHEITDLGSFASKQGLEIGDTLCCIGMGDVRARGCGRMRHVAMDGRGGKGVSERVGVACVATRASGAKRLCQGIEGVLGIELPHLDTFGLFVNDGFERFVLEE